MRDSSLVRRVDFPGTPGPKWFHARTPLAITGELAAPESRPEWPRSTPRILDSKTRHRVPRRLRFGGDFWSCSSSSRVAAICVYGSRYAADRISYGWESGRARADAEMLAKLDDGQIVNRASLLFRMATNAVSPAVVNVHSLRVRRGGDGMAGMQLGGGNRLSPGLAGSRTGLGGDHRQGSRVYRHEQPRRQGCGPDHGAARPGRRRAGRTSWALTRSRTWPFSR